MKVLQLVFGLVILFAATFQYANADQRWIYAQTEHFEMYSEAAEGESLKYLAQLEQFDGVCKKVFKKSAQNMPRAVVMMFASQRQMAPFLPLLNGRPKPVAGFYQSGADADFIVVSAEAMARGDDDDGNVVFHEYTHRLLHGMVQQLPTWLDEGLAEYFASMKFGKSGVEVGLPIKRREQCLRESRLLPLDQLLAVNHSSVEYNEDSRQHVFYAESWLLVHYLLSEPGRDWTDRLAELVETAGSSSGVLGCDGIKLEAAMRRYAGSRLETHLIGLAERDVSNRICFRPLDEGACAVALENLRWRVRPEEFSAFKLLELADREPGNAAPYEVLAASAWTRDSERPQALHYWEKAVARGSTNAFAYLQLARAQLRFITSSPSLDYRAPAAVADPIRKLLDRAIELRPDYPEAWEALAQIEAFAETPRSDVVARLQNMLPFMRSKTGTQVALAFLHWRIGDFATSRQLLDALKDQEQPKADVFRMMRRLRDRLEANEGAKTAWGNGQPAAPPDA